jgi:hypothetical protein
MHIDNPGQAAEDARRKREQEQPKNQEPKKPDDKK